MTGPQEDDDDPGDSPCSGCSEGTSRREVLGVLLSGVLGAGGMLAAAVDGISAAHSTDVPVAALDDVPPGSVVSAEYQGQPILVSNDAGEVRVMLAFCTHEGCEVEWSAGRGEMVCPCHDARFDLRGAVISGPPPSPS